MVNVIDLLFHSALDITQVSTFDIQKGIFVSLSTTSAAKQACNSPGSVVVLCHVCNFDTALIGS